MSLPISGPISMDEIHVAAGGISETEVNLNDTDVRNLAQIPTTYTEISFSDFYGKGSSGVRFNPEIFNLTQNSLKSATARIRLRTDGIIRYTDERLGTINGSWIEEEPADPSIYTAVATLTGRGIPQVGIFDEHLPLSTRQSWEHTITSGFFSTSFELSIYGANKETPLATTTVVMFLEIEGGGDGDPIKR
jgi:hypothetical protein